MKSKLLIAALAFASTTAFAGGVVGSVEFESVSVNTGGQINESALVLGYTEGAHTVDARVAAGRVHDPKDTYNDVEARYKYTFAPLTPLKVQPYVRASLGNRSISTSDSFNFYTAEAGASVPVYDKLSLVASYRVKDDVSNTSSRRYYEQRSSLGFEYALNKRTSVGLSYIYYDDSVTYSQGGAAAVNVAF